MSSHARGDISWCFGTRNGSDERTSHENHSPQCRRSELNNNNRSGDLMMTWADDDMRRGWGFLLFAAEHLNTCGGGVRAENYVFIFITRREARISFFYHTTHMICRLSFPFFSVWASAVVEMRERESVVNEPSASGDGILLLFPYETHMMGVCRVCLWIICRFMLREREMSSRSEAWKDFLSFLFVCG